MKSYEEVIQKLRDLGFSDEGVVFFIANFRTFISNAIDIEMAKNLTDEEIVAVRQYCEENHYDKVVEAQALINFYETKTGRTVDEFIFQAYEDILGSFEKNKSLMEKIVEIIKKKETSKILEELKGYFETLEKRNTREFIKQNVG